MDLGKVTVFVIRDFSDRNFAFIPFRKQKSHIIVEISKTCTVQDEKADAFGSEISCDSVNNWEGNWLQCTYKESKQQSVTVAKIVPNDATSGEISYRSGINCEGNQRQYILTEDKRESIGAGRTRKVASDVPMDYQIVSNGSYCKNKLKGVGSRLDCEKYERECVLIDDKRESRRICAEKVTVIANNAPTNSCIADNVQNRVNDIDSGIESEETEHQNLSTESIISTKIANRRNSSSLESDVVDDWQHCKEDWNEIEASMTTINGADTNFGELTPNRTVPFTSNQSSMTDVLHKTESNQTIVDIRAECEIIIDKIMNILEAEENIGTYVDDVDKGDCDVDGPNRLVSSHQVNAVSTLPPSGGENGGSESVDSPSITHADISTECGITLDAIIKTLVTTDNIGTDDAQTEDCDIDGIPNPLSPCPYLLPPSESRDDIITECSITLDQILEILEVEEYIGIDLDDVRKADCDVDEAPKRSLTCQQMPTPSEIHEDIMTECSTTLDKIIRTLESEEIFDIDVDDAQKQDCDVSVRPTLPPPGDDNRDSEVVDRPSITQKHDEFNEAVPSNKDPEDLQNYALNNIESTTASTQCSPKTTTTTVTTIETENVDITESQKMACLEDQSTNRTGTPDLLPLDLRCYKNHEPDQSTASESESKRKDCSPDKPTDNMALALKGDVPTVSNKLQLVKQTICPADKQSVFTNSSFKPISPPVFQHPMYEPISPPETPLNNSDEFASHPIVDISKTKLPTICSTLVTGRSYELISPELDEEELKKKAEKEFLKELWQEGSGRLVITPKDSNIESVQENRRIDNTQPERLHNSDVFECGAQSRSNLTPYQLVSHGTIAPANRFNNSETGRPGNNPVFDSAMQQQWNDSPHFYPNTGFQKGNNCSYDYSGRSFHPSQQHVTQEIVGRSDVYHSSSGNYAPAQNTPRNTENCSPNASWFAYNNSGYPYRDSFTRPLQCFTESSFTSYNTVPIRKFAQGRVSKKNKSCWKCSSQQLRDISHNVELHSNSTSQSTGHRKQPGEIGPRDTSQGLSSNCTMSSSQQLRDISNIVEHYTNSTSQSTGHRKQPGAIGPRDISHNLSTNCTMSSSQQFPDISNSVELYSNSTSQLTGHRKQPGAIGPREMYSRIPNYKVFPGNTMLDSASKISGPSTIQNAMPPPAPCPSHHSDRTENHFRMPSANTVNMNCTQAQSRYTTPQGVDSACYRNVRPQGNPIQQYRVAAVSNVYWVTADPQQTQQYRHHLPNAQYISQQSCPRNNSQQPSAQQQTQFPHPGRVTTPNGATSGNNGDHHIPPWHGNTRQVYVAPVNNQTTLGMPTTVGSSFVMPTVNELPINSSTSNVAIPHHKKQPIILPNPSGFTNRQPVSNFGRSQPPPLEPIESCPATSGQAGWSQSVQISGNQIRRVHNQPIRFQPSISHSVSLPSTGATTVTKSPADSRFVALGNSNNKEANVPPQLHHFLISMKDSCQTSFGTGNKAAADLCGTVPNNIAVTRHLNEINNPVSARASTNVFGIQSNNARYSLLQRSKSSFANSPSVNTRRLAGNTLPGDMLMTARGVGLPVSKKVNQREHNSEMLAHLLTLNDNPSVTSQPTMKSPSVDSADSTQQNNEAVSSTNVITLEERAPNARKRNSSSPQSNSSSPIVPFVQLKPSAKTRTSTPVSATPSSSLENKTPFVSVTARQISVEHACTQTPTSNDNTSSSLVSRSNKQQANSKGENATVGHQNSADAPDLAQSSLPIKKRTLSPQTSNDQSSDTSPGQSTSEKMPEQSNQKSTNYEKPSLSPTAETQHQDDAYGYDKESLAKALQQSNQFQTKDIPSATKPEFEKERNSRLRTGAKDASREKREKIPPTMDESENQRGPGDDEYGYDYESMVRAKQKAEQQQSQSSYHQTLADVGKTGLSDDERANMHTSPTKSQNSNDPVDSPYTSPQSGYGSNSRKYKRIIPPISSDSDSESEILRRHRERNGSKKAKHKKKWHRIIEPSESSDSEDGIDTTIQIRVHSPKSSMQSDHSDSTPNANRTSANTSKRRQDDFHELEQSAPKRYKLSESISMDEFSYMKSCRVVMRKIDDVFVTLRASRLSSEDDNNHNCELPESTAEENVCVERSSNSLRPENVDHNVQNDSRYGRVEFCDLNVDKPSRSLAVTFSQKIPEQIDPSLRSRPAKSQLEDASKEKFLTNQSKQCWREKQNDLFPPEAPCQTFIADTKDPDASASVDRSPFCSKPKDNHIQSTLLPETEQRWWENKNDTHETDTNATNESGTQWRHDQSYFSETDEFIDLSPIEENESPYHSEVDDTPTLDRHSDGEEISEKVTPILNNKISETSTINITTVTYENDLPRGNQNAVTVFDNRVQMESQDDEVDGEPKEPWDNIFEKMESNQVLFSDEYGELSSSYTSSNSGSPIKFETAGSAKDNEWPFSDEFLADKSVDEDEMECTRNIDDSNSHFEKETVDRQKNTTTHNRIGHKPNDFATNKTALVNVPEVQLTKFLKLRNRRTHKSRERRKKKDFFKEVGLCDNSIRLTSFEYLKLPTNFSSLSPSQNENLPVKTKRLSPILEGCSRTRGSIDVMNKYRRMKRSNSKTFPLNDTSNGERLKGSKDVSC